MQISFCINHYLRFTQVLIGLCLADFAMRNFLEVHLENSFREKSRLISIFNFFKVKVVALFI